MIVTNSISFDLYTDHLPGWFSQYDPEEKTNMYGKYYHLRVPSEDSAKVKRKCGWYRIRYRAYDSNMERSTTYRSDFFRYYRPPYRCRYCNRRLERKDLHVDHVISVYAAQTDRKTQRRMRRLGIMNVNDVRNLVPACPRCNLKKGSATWFWRARLGKYPLYWKARRTLRMALFFLAAYLVYDCVVRSGTAMRTISEAVSPWLRNIFGGMLILP